jgi:hypothetical protein
VKALSAGFAALRRWRLALLLLAATLVPALFAASTLWAALHDSFATTLAGEHVLVNDPRFAATDVLEFFHEKRVAVGAAWDATLAAAGLALIMRIFLAGGLIETLGRKPSLGPLEFLAGAGRNFWHNLKCFGVFAVALALTMSLWFAAASAWADRALRPPSSTALPGLLARALLTILLYVLLALWYDLARAVRRLRPGIGARSAYWLAATVLRRRGGLALGLSLFWLCLGGGVFAALLWLTWTASAVSSAGIALLFVLQVAALSVQPLARVAAWGSYLSLLESTELAPRSARAAPREGSLTEAPGASAG